MESGTPLHHYTLLCEIGQGAMGRIFRARNERNGQIVAIKLITKNGAGYNFDWYTALLKEEARIQERLSTGCSGLASFFEIGVGKEDAYIAMELLEGESLKSLLNRKKKLPRKRAFEIAISVAKTIAYANDHGVIHRDIKPDNIFIEANGGVRVIDFGIAMQRDGSALRTRSDQFLGTPAYASPHQGVRSSEADGSDEAWSITSVFYEMLTGERAHPGDDAVHVRRRLHILPEQRALDSQTWQIICRGLNFNRKKQYASVRELLEDLTHVLAGPVKPKTDLPRQPPPSPRDRPWLRAVGNVAFVLAVNAITVCLFGGSAEPPPQAPPVGVNSPREQPPARQDAGPSRVQAEPVPADRSQQVAWLRRNSGRLSPDRLRRWCSELARQQRAVPGTRESNLPLNCAQHMPVRRSRKH